MSKLTQYFIALVFVVAIVFGLSILLAYPIMWLWNSTMPELVGAKEIGVWMAWKIAMLAGILVRGIQIPLK